MTRKKSHKPGGEPRQAKPQSKTTVPTPATVVNADKMAETTSLDDTVHKVDTLEGSDRPSKRARVGNQAASEVPQFANPTPEDHAWHFEKDLTFNIPVSILPPHLQSLKAKYEFSTMSIISSSKIETKVKTLLTRLGTFSWANKDAKPVVVILSAKAGVANKMISVVEIAKRELEVQGAKWWQYSRVHSQVTELKEKPGKGTDGGKTLLQWETEQAAKSKAEAQDLKDVVEDSNMIDADGAEEDEEDAFEAVAPNGNDSTIPPTEEITARKKIRAVPVMTIYMSRVHVEELKQAYGYVLPSHLRATSELRFYAGSRQTPSGTLSAHIHQVQQSTFSGLIRRFMWWGQFALLIAYGPSLIPI